MSPLFCLAFVLLAVDAQADEPVTIEPVTAEPVTAEPVTAQLEAEVLRYYLGIGVEPTEAEAAAGLSAASDLLLAGISSEQLSAAVDEALERHEAGTRALFQVAVPRFLRAARAIAAPDDSVAGVHDASARPSRSRQAPRDWKKRFSLEVERHQRDWGIVTAVMLGVVGGVAAGGLLVSAGAGDESGLIVGLTHLGSLGFLAHFLNTANSTLGGIKGVVASSPSAEEALRRMHKARVGTGVAALIVAGLGTALVPLAFAPDDYAWLVLPAAIGCGVAALTLLSISSAHLTLAAEFERLAAGVDLRSARKAPAVGVVVTPTGIVGWF